RAQNRRNAIGASTWALNVILSGLVSIGVVKDTDLIPLSMSIFMSAGLAMVTAASAFAQFVSTLRFFDRARNAWWGCAKDRSMADASATKAISRGKSMNGTGVVADRSDIGAVTPARLGLSRLARVA